MAELRYTLLSDGSSDRGLIPVLNWTLRRHLPDLAIQHEWADLRRLRQPPRGLSDKMDMALSLYPCDLLFVHRDAETAGREDRLCEIHEGLSGSSHVGFPHVPVIPVRMTEAWLLISEPAIRAAAGDPRGDVTLRLPEVKSLEDLPDPKRVLYDLLRRASGLRGRRLHTFRTARCATRVAAFIDDFSALRELVAYLSLESDVRAFATTYLERN